MHDIVGTMFNKRFVEELFKPQDTYSKKAMRTVFDRLAHASIMRLNTASMDKVQYYIFSHLNSLAIISIFIDAHPTVKKVLREVLIHIHGVNINNEHGA